MSLLLDALKKAADDKQKASQSDSAGASADVAKAEESKNTDKPELLASENESSPELVLDELKNNVPSDEDLTLEDVDVDVPADSPHIDVSDNLISDVDSGITERASVRQDKNTNRSKTAASGVSDEALSMLIYKTNREVKNNKRIIFISIFLLSFLVLGSGGIYYYMDTQAEIAAFEHKHQIAMQAMRHKTSSEETPAASDIIRNLVSKSDLDDKVKFAKQQITSKKSGAGRMAQASTATASKKYVNEKARQQNKSVNIRSSSVVSFQKTKKADPVGEKLAQAWHDYEVASYSSAKILYKDVLRIENGNRDALLGLGAIAVIEKNNRLAREIYMDLLKKDPRDPIAISALSGLQSDAASLEESEKYLLGMLQNNPEAAELNFALGNNYAQQDKWKAAQRYYFSAWQYNPENADYLFNLAVSLDQLGKSKQALKFYNDSLLKSNNRQVSFSREAVQQRIVALSEL